MPTSRLRHAAATLYAIAFISPVIAAAGAPAVDGGSPITRSGGGVRTTARGDAAALFGNVSLIADQTRPTLFVDASQGALAATFPLARFGVISVGALDMGSEDRFLVDRPWNPFGTFETGTNRASVGYALKIEDRLSFGASVDGWRDPSGDWDTGASAGILVEPNPALHIGVATSVSPSGDPLTRYGFSVQPSRRLQLHVEAQRSQIAAGLASEWRDLALRVGSRSFMREHDPILSVGGSARLSTGLSVHYAYEFSTPDVGRLTGWRDGTHTVSLDVPLWRLGTPPPPAPARAAIPRVVNSAGGAIIEPPRGPASPGTAPGVPVPERVVRSAVDPVLDLPSSVGTLRELIEHHAAKYGVEVPLILAKMRTESSFNPRAVSPSKAVGLFQLLPPAARDMGIPLRDEDILDPEKDLRFDPLVNADAGIRYLAHLLNRFGWNYVLAIAGYNAGPGLIQGEVPARAETERHVGKVLNYYYQYRNDPAALADAWSRIDAIPTRDRQSLSLLP